MEFFSSRNGSGSGNSDKSNDSENIQVKTYSNLKTPQSNPFARSTSKNPKLAVKSDDSSTEDHRLDLAVDELNRALSDEIVEKPGVAEDISSPKNKLVEVNSPRLSELDRQQASIEAISDEVMQYEIMLHNLHNKLNGITKFISGTRMDFKNFDHATNETRSLKVELEQTKRQLQEAAQKVSSQTAKITQYDVDRKENRSVLESARKELTHAIEQGKTSTSELEMQKAAFTRLELSKQVISNNLENVSTHNNAMVKKCELIMSEIAKLNEVNGKLEKRIELLSTKSTDLVKERDLALQQLVVAQTDIGSRNQAIASLTSQLNSARQEIRSNNEQFEIKTRHREGEVLSLKSTLDQSDEENRQLKEKLELGHLETAELKTKNSTETDKRFELEKRCAELSEKIVESEKSTDAAQSSYDALNARYLLTKSELEKQRASNSESDRKPLKGAPEMFFTPAAETDSKKTSKKPVKVVKKKIATT